MKRHKRINFTTRYVVVAGIILLATNIILGIVNFNSTTSLIRSLINKDMLDLANTAAALIDGDELGALTEEDVGSDAFNEILNRLSAFQYHADIHYIYAIKQVGPEEFVFTVDADPDDPGAFGEETVVTPAMIQAGQGTASVDEEPAADRWGNYYSAFSPVFDTQGHVAGVIGVDFDADWYDKQVRNNALSITFTSVLSVLGIAVVVALLTQKVHSKLHGLDTGLSALAASMEKLTLEVGSMPGKEKHAEESPPSGDVLEELRGRIDYMQENLRIYLDHLQAKAFIDALTNVQNSTAYHETLQEITERIDKGSADFCVGVFDINSLKEINDQYGHEYGDRIIQGTAKAIAETFGIKNTYRIGGDEFAVIMPQTTESAMAEMLSKVDKQIKAYNAENENTLAVSKGISAFQPGVDTCYKDVFSRADRMMYEDKRNYYRINGDRRNGRSAR